MEFDAKEKVGKKKELQGKDVGEPRNLSKSSDVCGF